MNFDDDDSSDDNFTAKLAMLTAINDVVRSRDGQLVADTLAVFITMNGLADDVLKRLLNLGEHRLVGVPAVAVN